VLPAIAAALAEAGSRVALGARGSGWSSPQAASASIERAIGREAVRYVDMVAPRSGDETSRERSVGTLVETLSRRCQADIKTGC
jgi:hypothetical protein